MLSRDKRLPIMESVWITVKRFCQSTFYVRVITNTLSMNSSLYDTKCYRCGSSACLYGHLLQEVKNEFEAQSQCRHFFFRKGVDHEFLSVSGYSTKFLWLDSKDSRYRNCNSINSLHFLHSYVEDKIQKTSDYLFLFSIGGFVMDQRSRDGRFIG